MIYIYRNTRLSRVVCRTVCGVHAYIKCVKQAACLFLDWKRKKCKGKIKPCSFTCAEASLSFESFDISQQRYTDRPLVQPSQQSLGGGRRMAPSAGLEEGTRGSRLVESSVSAVAGVVTICCQLSGFCSWGRLHDDGITICVWRMRRGQHMQLPWFIWIFYIFTFIINLW